MIIEIKDLSKEYKNRPVVPGKVPYSEYKKIMEETKKTQTERRSR